MSHTGRVCSPNFCERLNHPDVHGSISSNLGCLNGRLPSKIEWHSVSQAGRVCPSNFCERVNHPDIHGSIASKVW